MGYCMLAPEVPFQRLQSRPSFPCTLPFPRGSLCICHEPFMALLFLHTSPEGSPSGFQTGQMPARAHFLRFHLSYLSSPQTSCRKTPTLHLTCSWYSYPGPGCPQSDGLRSPAHRDFSSDASLSTTKSPSQVTLYVLLRFQIQVRILSLCTTG